MLITSGAPKAAGLDGWRPAQWKQLTQLAAHWLVCLLQLVEAGSQWPADCHVARDVFLMKPSTVIENPLTFRVLTILPVLYRAWGKMRINDVTEWTRHWSSKAMYSAQRGVGAADAWYDFSLRIEHSKMMNGNFAGISIDLFKCFDRICRDTVVVIAVLSGFPLSLALAIIRFFDKVVHHLSLSVGVGRPTTGIFYCAG